MNSTFVFRFNNQGKVRIIVSKHGEIWFVLDDLCKVLGLSDVSPIVQMLDKDEKSTYTVRTLFGNKKMSVISELGLWDVVYHYKVSSVEKVCEWLLFKVKPVVRGFRKPDNFYTEFIQRCLKILDLLKRCSLTNSKGTSKQK